MSKANRTKRSRRLNVRALIVLTVLLVVVAPGLVVLKGLQQKRGREAYLNEAKAQLAKKQLSLALGYLNHYLELSPDDLSALDLKAKILTDEAKNPAQADDAIQVNNVLMSRATDKEMRQEIRRRLAKLHLMIPGHHQAAETVARELLDNGASDADAYRLHARALVFVGILTKKPDLVEKARGEYETAEAKDPGQVEGTEEFARLYREELGKPDKAREILDHLVAYTAKVPQKHAEALLARARHYVAVHEMEKAKHDVDLAIDEAPKDKFARLTAAELSVRNNDPTSARKHLAALDEESRKDLRVKVLEGEIDLVEQRTDDAIAAWRAGLLSTGGTDADLTWRLANILLEIGRVDEARILVTQYHRLAGGESTDPRSVYLDALLLFKTNHPAEAADALEKIRFKADKRLEPHVYYILGQAYENMKSPAKAMEAYQHAAEVARDWSTPWSALARLQMTTRPTEAMTSLNKGLALHSEDPRLLAILAGVLWREQLAKPRSQRNWTEVEEVIGRAKKRSPNSPELALVESDFYESTDRFQDGVELLAAASAIHPHDQSLWLARANMLARHNQVAPALEVIDKGLETVGPRAGFFISRASVLILKGQQTAASKVLLENISRVPREDRPLMWKTLGELYQSQNKLKDARAAFQERVKLQPDNPEARLTLLMLDVKLGNEEEINKSIEGLKSSGGADNYYWRFAQVENLLRDRPDEKPDKNRDEARLDEAQKLIDEIKTKDPQLPLGYMLAGRLAEKRNEVDKAIVAYREALKLDAGQTALTPLINLLVREGRDTELDQLREMLASLPIDVVDRQAAIQALKQGKKGRAEQLAEMAVRGDPLGIDTRVWQAEVLKALGKPKDAEKTLRDLIKQHPQEPTPWIQLLMLQIGQHDRTGAAATVEQIRTQVKTGFPELLWAQCYRAIGDVRNAAECYQLARNRWPDDPTILTATTNFYEQIGQRDQLETVLQQLHKLDPSNGWATRRLALSRASRVGDLAAWKEGLDLIGAEAQPNDVLEDAVTRANIYVLSPEPEHQRKAIAIIEGLLNEMPSLATLHEQLAKMLLRRGDLAQAREHAEKAATGEKPSSDAIQIYAETLVALKELDAAEAQLQRLEAIDPEGLPSAELKAKILVARGKPEEGAKVLEDAFNERVATSSATLIGEKMLPLFLGMNQPAVAERVLRKMTSIDARYECRLADMIGVKQPEEAVKLLQEAAKTGDGASAAATALKLASATNGDKRWLDLADRLITDLSKRQPNSLAVLDMTSLLRHFQKNYDAEIAAYEAILAQKPASFMFLNNMAWTLSENLGKPEEGLKRANEAVERAGPLANILDTRGVIYTRLGQYDKAIRDLEIAAQAQKSASIYYHLARAYQKKGDVEQFHKNRDLALKAGLTRDQLQPTEQSEWDAFTAP